MLLVSPSIAILRVLTIAAMRPNHRLRCSASPVLTATGFVNGKGQFSTPYRIDTPEPITKKFVTGDYVGDTYIRPRGLLGTWVKYNENYFYLCPFLGTRLEVRPVDGFSRMIAQTTRTRARMFRFGDFLHCWSFKGSKPPKKQFWGMSMRFFKTCIKLSKLLHRCQPNFAQ